MRRPRRAILPTILSLALLATGCGSDGDDGTDGPTDAPTEAIDGVSEDLPEGVAARVGEQEISTQVVDARVESIASQPDLQQQLEGEQGEALRAQIEAQVLTEAILTEVVLDIAEERDIQITDEDIAERRSQVEEQAGGPQELESSLEQAGVSGEAFEHQLRAAVALDRLSEQFTTATETPTDGPTAAPTELPAAQQELQQFVLRQLQEADIVVDEQYGQWVPSQQRVVPDVAPPTPQGALTPQTEAATPAPAEGSG